MYSLQQKECLTTLDKKSSVFLTVNLYENFHASTYTIYESIYKIKKNRPRTVRGHQPPRRAANKIGTSRALALLYVRDKRRRDRLLQYKETNVGNARGGIYDQSYQNGSKSGLPSAAGFLTLYMYSYIV